MFRLILLVIVLITARQASAIDIADIQGQLFNGSCALSGCHNGSTSPDLSDGSSMPS